MRRILLFTGFLLAATGIRAMQANSTETSTLMATDVKSSAARAAADGSSAPAPGAVSVYPPHKPVVAPRLLPPPQPVKYPKHCIDTSEGQSELSLLVDTAGRARNIMFLKPSGTLADQFAITIANQDRFAPGTLNGKPVVVAETLDIRMEACIGEDPDAQGKMERAWLLKSRPHQKLSKPKDPPQVAKLTPLNPPNTKNERLVRRPDFFGNGESAPVLIYSDYADYKPLFPGTKGTCEVSLIVDEHGLPQDLHVLKKLDPGLDVAALEAVENYRFFPAIKDDTPVSAAVVVSVDFAPPK